MEEHDLRENRLTGDGGEHVRKTPRRKPKSRNRTSRAFARYNRMARCPVGLSLRSLRDPCASWLVMDGVDIYRVQKLMRRKSVVTTMRYAHRRRARAPTVLTGRSPGARTSGALTYVLPERPERIGRSS